MKLISKGIANEFIKSFSFKKFEIDQNFCDKLNTKEAPAEANLITENEKINSYELAKLKLILEKHYIKLSNIYSNNIEIILSGKSLKINSTFLKIKDLKNQLPLDYSYLKKDILHKGKVVIR